MSGECFILIEVTETASGQEIEFSGIFVCKQKMDHRQPERKRMDARCVGGPPHLTHCAK